MSTTVSFLPNGDADRGIWMGNFSLKLPTYAAALGISAAEVTSVKNDAAMYQYILGTLEAYKQTVNQLTSYKNMLRHAVGQQHLGALPAAPALGTAPAAVSEGVFDRVSKLATRIKNSANYTDAIGHDLGIIASVPAISADSLQPDLKVKLDAGRPHLKCTKGMADAIDLYVDRKDGSGWQVLGRLIKTDYIDTAALPAATALAEWDYKAMYVIGNDQAGLMSAIVSVLVKKL